MGSIQNPSDHTKNIWVLYSLEDVLAGMLFGICFQNFSLGLLGFFYKRLFVFFYLICSLMVVDKTINIFSLVYLTIVEKVGNFTSFEKKKTVLLTIIIISHLSLGFSYCWNNQNISCYKFVVVHFFIRNILLIKLKKYFSWIGLLYAIHHDN